MADSQLPKSQRVCQVEGCNEKFLAKGLCRKHYDQMWVHGHILPRTIYDPNNFILSEDVCRIELFDKHGKKVADTFVDIEDYSHTKNIKWGLMSTGYVATYVAGKVNLLHRFIMNVSKDVHIDHIDHNPLNNRKSNLRVCNVSQNLSNQKLSVRNSSGFKNVYWDKFRNKWAVEVKANKIKRYIGRFTNIEDAKQAAIRARKEYHGEFAYNG